MSPPAAMKNGFVGTPDLEYTSQNHSSIVPENLISSHDKAVEERESDPIVINRRGIDNEGLHARKSSSSVPEATAAAMENPLSSPATTTPMMFAGARDASSTYDVLWCRTKSWIESMKHVPWKNGRAPPGRAYNPTEVS